ncbi:hypothetical protein SMACR_07146 [Sordaria macrospora]|uniref:WGS project CABT00000000 data, contig 2.40 n=2 Tax=Sordaria macrospora TaxID=5147 RepID=F7W7N0_SORMK|nr:uncharacterized protein SMAC_07146 [Sordaria macrospora k-hell]KAA8628765.1 hypothetical protein SMACR_07146 [Sordaria macrospora]CCC13522.1 unnamed protein product [Sordaria macrospora k-hell]
MNNTNTNNHEQTLRSTRSSTRLANRSVNKSSNESKEISDHIKSSKTSGKSSETSSMSKKTDKFNKAADMSKMTSNVSTTASTPIPSAAVTTHPLGLWNNIAPRTYTPRALCFPFSPSARLSPLTAASTLLWFLRIQLLRIIKTRPSFAGKLQLGINLSADEKRSLKKMDGKYNPWHVYLQTSPDYEIPLTAQYPANDGLMRAMYSDLEARFAPTEVEGWHKEYMDYENLRRAEFPVGPFINPLLHDLRTLREGGEALPALQMEEPCEELLAKCPEYKEWEDHERNGPTHPICPSLPGHEGESSTGSSKIFVFTFAKIVELQKEVAAQGVKSGIYECLSGLLWTLTYVSRVRASSIDPSSFEKFLHDHFAEEQPVFSTPTDWIARVAALKSTDPEVVAFKEQIAKDTKEYMGNKITWISTCLPSASLLTNAAAKGGDMDFAALAEIVSAINKSSSDMAEDMPEFITTRTNLFQSLSQTSPGDDIRRIGLSFDPRQPSEWQMNSWKNFGADTEWRFPPLPSLTPPSSPMVPTNTFSESASESYSHREVFNVTKPDAVRRVQARYGVSGGLWLPARKDQKKEVLVQISLPEEAMEVFEGLMKEGKWVERVI